MKRGLAALAGLVALSLPELALACAACVSATDRNRTAFLITTILLSLLPLAMIAGGLWWIARRARGSLAGEFADRDSASGAALRATSFPAEPKIADSISGPHTTALDPAP